jgi:S1-C subfamily serine protease
MKKQTTLEEVNAQVKDFARKKPLSFIIVIIAVIVVLFGLLSSLEILPEFSRPRSGRGMVIEKGDSLDWIGMQVAPVSRNIRKEFNIPGRVKGMFVLDEGAGEAKKYGVKTGDVIVSIGRRPVPNARAFVNVANTVQYSDGILLDIYRGKDTLYITVPFEYQYGPLWGPHKGSWQLGAPLLGQKFPYGPLINNNNNNQNR